MRIRRLEALVSFASVLAMAAPACGAPIGARLYVQPWDPRAPSQDAVQTIYDDPSAVSGPIDDAWNTTRAIAGRALPQALAEVDVGGGFRLYDVALTTNPISGYRLRQTGPNTARLDLVVPATTVDASIRTPGPVPNGVDPRFRVSGDLVVEVEIAFSTDPGQLLHAGKVDAVLMNVGPPQGLNDSARTVTTAAQIVNDLVAFFSGTNFEQKLLDAINGQDLGRQALQPLIDSKLATLNAAFASQPQLARALPKAVWADHDRLTFYFAAPAMAPPTTGVLAGAIAWDPTQVSGACGQVAINGVVQTGPRPLLDSSGGDYGPAPTETVGSISTFATGPASCVYRVTGLGLGVPNALKVSTTYAPIGGRASASPYVGGAHTVAVLSPVGWDDTVVTPNAEGRNFTIVRGDAARPGVGAQLSAPMRRPMEPGDERAAAPGVTSTLNPQPLPPRVRSAPAEGGAISAAPATR